MKLRSKMPELKEVFSGVLVKALNLTEAEVSSLYSEDGNPKDDALDSILAKHAEGVKKVREANKAASDQAFARGVREKGEEFEKLLKEAGVEVGDAKGADAVQKLKDHIAAQAKPSDLDDDKVKNSAYFRKREQELLELVKSKDAEHKKAMTDRDAKEQRERTIAEARKERDDLVKTLKPILPEDPEKQRRLLSVIDRAIEDHSYETEGETVYVIDKEGKRKETNNGVPVTRKQFLEAEIRATYDLPVSDPKGTAGDPTKGTTKSVLALHKPATRVEYAKQVNAITEDSSLSAKEKGEKLQELKTLAGDVAA